MQSLVPSEVTGRVGPAPDGGSFRGREVRMIEYRGLLPEQPVYFLRRLSFSERRDVYAIRGIFKEVRSLVGTARLLHHYLEEAPRAAARGRTTFQEFLAEKIDLLRDIAALRVKVNRAAANVCLILPRVPQLTMEEVCHEYAGRSRVS